MAPLLPSKKSTTYKPLQAAKKRFERAQKELETAGRNYEKAKTNLRAELKSQVELDCGKWDDEWEKLVQALMCSWPVVLQ